jgi:hypothetical protein
MKNKKVHVFGGISRKGATKLIIFDGTYGFTRLIKKSVVPFINEKLPFSHHLYMDNSPIHNSRAARRFLNLHLINPMRGRPQSPVI